MSHDDRVFAMYDISSSSVAGAHVLHAPGHKPVILTSLRTNIQFQEDIDIKRFVEQTAKNLEHIVSKIQIADVHHPDYVQVMLASPWYSSQTRTITYTKQAPFTCTQKLVDGLIEAELKHMNDHSDGPFGPFGKDSVVVEKQISKITLNGYPTGMPFGKKVNAVELSLTVTIAPKAILNTFSDVLRRAYGARPIRFTTSPFATYIVMRDTLPNQEECVVIDVGEEVTDVAFVKDGVFLYQHSFPVGTYSLYRVLMEHGHHTAIEIEALLESYRLGKLTKAASRSIEKAITTFTDEWQRAFQQILEAGQYGFCMPEHIFITADTRFQLLLTDIIINDPFIKHSCARGAVATTFMDQTLLELSINTTDHSRLDIPLAIGALFSTRLV